MSDVGDNEIPIEVDEVEVKEAEAPKGKMCVGFSPAWLLASTDGKADLACAEK